MIQSPHNESILHLHGFIMYINNVSSSYFSVVSLREHQVDRVRIEMLKGGKTWSQINSKMP